MKGLTKTIVALALVITVLATMGMSAMAATGTYSTKTIYQADNKISVEANAAGLEKGDIVTYVATTDASDVNDQTIVYINQAEADEAGTAKFTYTTGVTNINASMFFGGSKESERQSAKAEGGFEVTVKIGESEKVVSVPEQDGDIVVIRKFDLSNFANFSATNIKSVKFNDTVIPNDCVYADATTLMVSTNLIKEAGTLEITTTETVGFGAPRISATTAVVEDNLVAVAKAPAGEKFGIVVYTGEKPASLVHEYSNSDGVIVLPTLGKNVDGIYAVEVEAIADFAGAKFNVAAYAFDGTSAVISDAIAIGE